MRNLRIITLKCQAIYEVFFASSPILPYYIYRCTLKNYYRLTTLALCLFTLSFAACDEGGDKSGDTGATSGDDDDDVIGDDDDNNGQGHAAACAGDQGGSYQIDGYPVSGNVSGELLADGTLYITFVTSGGNTNAEAEISASGVMSGNHDGVIINGTYDLTACQGTGRWIDSFGAQGDYDLGTL